MRRRNGPRWRWFELITDAIQCDIPGVYREEADKAARGVLTTRAERGWLMTPPA